MAFEDINRKRENTEHDVLLASLLKAYASKASNSDKSFGDLEVIVKAITFLAIIFYIIGLLTVNTYLYRLGISELSLIKDRYVYIGGLTLTLISILSIPPLIFVISIISLPEFSVRFLKSEWSPLIRELIRFSILILMNLVIVVYIYAFVWFISQVDNFSGIQKTSLLHPMIIVLTNSFFAICIFLFYRMMKKRKPHNQFFYKSLIVATFLLAITWYIVLLSQYYAVIPSQFGGGAPRIAQILFKKDEVSGIRQLGIPMVDSTSSDNQLSEHLTVLFESDQVYLLRLQKGQLVQVKKEIVQGIKYEK